jgi:phosphatidylserine synthase
MKRRSMLSFAGDLPNVVSLIGLFCAVAAIYLTILGYFPYAVIAILWAVVFDWADGIVARRMKGRTEDQKSFGADLDSLIDIVSFGAFPAIFLLSYGAFNLWFLPGAFLISASAAIRLSYFNLFGLTESKSYRGLALDNNILLLAVLFLFEQLITQSIFAFVLYGFMMVLAGFNISSIQTPKFSARWFLPLVVFVTALSLMYGFFI